MGLLGFNFQYGIILQAIAIVHFIRRRPEYYWLFLIFMGGGLGAMIYIAVEVVPDLQVLEMRPVPIGGVVDQALIAIVIPGLIGRPGARVVRAHADVLEERERRVDAVALIRARDRHR